MKWSTNFTVVFLGASIAALTSSCHVLPPVLTAEIACQSADLVLIQAGWFQMGEDDGRISNQPKHKVYLDVYCIQRTEVTSLDFSAFISATGYQSPGWSGQPDVAGQLLPVVGVRWRDANAYCLWKGLRLPSEAEWEKAARGDDSRRYPWGNDWDSLKANTAQADRGQLTPVGSYPKGASPFGILDMCGNAAEWVADFFDPAYYLSSPDHNPLGPTVVLDHGLRGGSFASPPEQATTYFRDSSHSVKPNPRVGFRCAISFPR